MDTLLAHIPKVYVNYDSDMSLRYLFESLEEVWQETNVNTDEFALKVKLASSTVLVEEWLAEVGNPFWVEALPVETKRRLVNVVLDFYLTRGTLVGLSQAVEFFTGLQPTLSLDYQHAWKLGQSTLGMETLLLKYTASQIKVQLNSSVSDNTRRLLATVIEFFKPLHMGWTLETL